MKLPRLAALSDFLFPRTCSVCGGRLSISERHFCMKCYRGLPVTNYYKQPSNNFAYNLFKLQIPVERAISFMRYMPDSIYANPIKTMKYYRDRKLSVCLGEIMAENIDASFFQGIDIIVPVPITWWRRRKRGYNQSELLAEGISRITNIPIAANAVKRKHFHTSQTQMSRLQRKGNVTDAFVCRDPELLDGKHILLIDDIITTGSTLLSLARCIEAETRNVRFSIYSLGITNELALM